MTHQNAPKYSNHKIIPVAKAEGTKKGLLSAIGQFLKISTKALTAILWKIHTGCTLAFSHL